MIDSMFLSIVVATIPTVLVFIAGIKLGENKHQRILLSSLSLLVWVIVFSVTYKDTDDCKRWNHKSGFYFVHTQIPVCVERGDTHEKR